jgi:hypothetical protein
MADGVESRRRVPTVPQPAAGAEVEPSASLTEQRHGGDRGNGSGGRRLHQLDDLLLYHGAPVLERVRHRPQVPVVEVGRVLEAQG